MQVDQIILEFNDDPQKYFSNMMISVSEQAVRQRLIEQKDIVKIGENKYALTIWSDFSVAENTTRRLRIFLATKNYVDSVQMPAIIQIGLPAQGVRAFDRFGNYYYSDAPVFFRNVIINRSYAGEAEITLSKNANSPLSRNIIADSKEKSFTTTIQKIDNATLLVFDIKTTKGQLILNELNDVNFEVGDKYLVPEEVYLLDDEGFVLSSAIPDNNGKVNFRSFYSLYFLTGYPLPKNSTKTFFISINDALAEDDNGKVYRVAVDSAGVVATKYDGQKLENDKKSGIAVSNDAYAYTKGPVFTLASIATSSTQASPSASSTISATFNIQVQAKNGDVYIPKTDAFVMKCGKNNMEAGFVPYVSYVQPSGAISGTDAYKITADSTVTFAVNATHVGSVATYDLRVDEIKWALSDVAADNANSSDYMSGQWISNAVYLQ